jgi:hypothetical protein
MSPELGHVITHMTSKILTEMDKALAECLDKMEARLAVAREVEKTVNGVVDRLQDRLEIFLGAKSSKTPPDDRTVGRRRPKPADAPPEPRGKVTEEQVRYNRRAVLNRLSKLKRQIISWMNCQQWITADAADESFGALAFTTAKNKRKAIARAMASLHWDHYLDIRRENRTLIRYRLKDEYRGLVDVFDLQPVG